ncbi:glutaminyl-peptide cyclotransferase [Pseudocnuella soli]|uniref:glutaminyl-peptide cyclotransferase n=1 Tax=Pseudocnuella soli TaxID=2502779 RepID=UPI00104F647A|nr:glutaminyl-peptide cyclotransferase [Pseudocnuella soli]
MKWLHILLIAGTSCIFFACANSDQSANDGGTGITSNVQQLSYSVAATYPHDTSSFTQGLEFYNGKLLESTGNLGKSKLMQVDMATGNAVTSKPLSAELFGEGLTVLNDTLYQLTWQNRKVLVYDAKSLQPIKELPLNTDGWGIANDGQNLIVTDGSSNLYFYEPGTFRLLRTQGVTMDETPIGNLNELEFINGFLYANIWQTPYIVKIDPSSGQVLARLDFSDLVQRVKTKIPQYDTGNEATLNGIAYDSTTRKIYITGKYWPELYEVQFEH